MAETNTTYTSAYTGEQIDGAIANVSSIINGTQPVGALGATQITTQDLNTFYGADWWGKTLFMAGGNSVLNKPAGVDAGNVNILRGAFDGTIQIAIEVSDSTGNSPAPNIYIRRLIGSTSSWEDWEQIVTADGSYPTLGAGYLATQIKITARSSALVGWNKFAEISYGTTSTNYSYSAILLVNGVHSTQLSTNNNTSESGTIEVDFYKEAASNPTQIGILVLGGNINVNEICAVLDSANSKIYLYSYFNLYQSISYLLMSEEQGLSSKPAKLVFSSEYYGTTAPTGAVYAVVRNNASYADTASYAATASYADIAETLTEPFAVGKDTTAATTGYVKFASVSLPGAYRSASARFEILDKNPLNAQTNVCGLEIVIRNINTTSVTVVPRLLYGSSAYLSKIYACSKTGAYPVIVDLYFNITSTNPQETIACIKPLFTFPRVTGSTTFTFITDNVVVPDLPTDTTNTQLSTVYELVTEANTATKALESNNNLLQNGDFTLNTQGQSSYPSGEPYNTDEFVDGWKMIESATRTGSVDVISGGGVTVNATGASFGIRQTLDKSFAGQTITLTIKISEMSGNSPFTPYIWNTAYNANSKNVRVTAPGIYTVTYTVPETETANLEIYLSYAGSLWVDNSSVTIDWAKLEEGSISTAPNGLVQNATRALYANKADITDANNANNVTTQINGQNISDIFESNGVTVKNATNASRLGGTPASNFYSTNNAPPYPVTSVAELTGAISTSDLASELRGYNAPSTITSGKHVSVDFSNASQSSGTLTLNIAGGLRQMLNITVFNVTENWLFGGSFVGVSVVLAAANTSKIIVSTDVDWVTFTIESNSSALRLTDAYGKTRGHTYHAWIGYI